MIWNTCPARHWLSLIRGQRSKVKVDGHRMRNVHFPDVDACYDVTYFWLFVTFFLSKWSVRPRVSVVQFCSRSLHRCASCESICSGASSKISLAAVPVAMNQLLPAIQHAPAKTPWRRIYGHESRRRRRHFNGHRHIRRAVPPPRHRSSPTLLVNVVLS